MAKIYTANFAPNQKTWTAALSDNSTGTELLVTAGPEGAIVTSVTAMPRETVTASSLLLFLSRYGGTTQRLIASELMPAHTMDATTATPITAFEGISETTPIRLEAGDQLFIGTGVAGNIVAFAQSIDYQSRAPEPKNVEPPAIERLAVEGNIATVDVGLWSGYPTPEITVQWLRDGVPIEGATALEYVPTTDDTFLPLSVAVTAANSSGSETVVTQALMVQPDAAVSWLYSDMAETIFVDVDGNTPATWGDPVGLIRDASPNRADFTQPTVTARPILGRVPRGGRRNTVINSTPLGSGYHSYFDSVIAVPAGEGPRGSAVQLSRAVTGASVWNYTQPQSDAWEEGGTYRTTIAIKNIDAETSRIRFRETHYDAKINWNDPIASGLTPIEGWPDWYLVEITGPAASAEILSNRRIFIYPENNSTLPSGSVLVSGLQVEAGDETTPYQLVTSPYDVTESGVEDIHYLSFDLTDDNLTTTLPAIENGTLVIAGTGGIWIDDDYNFDGGTFSIGPTSYPNGPQDILTAIGEPIVGGFLVINRQLTQLERELVIQELKERGAPGVFELGPELVVNGDFSDGLEGWIAAEQTTLEGGSVRIQRPQGDPYNLFLSQENPGLGGGDTVVLTLNVTSRTEGSILTFAGSNTPAGAAGGPQKILPQRSGLVGSVLKDLFARPYWGFTTSTNSNILIDSISLRKLELVP